MNWKKSLSARFRSIDRSELVPVVGIILAVPFFTLVGIFLVNASNDSIGITSSGEYTQVQEALPILTLGPAGTSVRVEVADNPEAWSVGLMYRTELPQDQGMLFIFNDSQVRNFWMKNTFVPLDIIFFDENKTIVAIHENAITNNTQIQYSSILPSKYALEANAGFAKAHNLKLGDKITSSYP